MITCLEFLNLKLIILRCCHSIFGKVLRSDYTEHTQSFVFIIKINLDDFSTLYALSLAYFAELIKTKVIQ